MSKYVCPIKSKAQIEQIKQELLNSNYRDYVIFCLAINYGRRITDILEMRVSDVRDDNGLIRSHFAVTENKTGKSIQIAVNEETKQMLLKYCRNKADEEWLFPSKKKSSAYQPDCFNQTPIDRVQCWRAIKKAAEKCGIPEIGTHSLRKTFGYWLYKSTGDIALVQKIFGHHTQLDTLRYIGMEQEYIDSATSTLVL